MSRLCAAIVLLTLSCGGGGGSDNLTAPPDNTVARIDLTPAAPLVLASGTTATLTATAFTRNGRVSAASVTWASSDANIANVSGGVVTARLVGTAQVTASAGSVTSSAVSVTVSPGSATQLALRTQPNGAAHGLALTTPPVVEVRDAAGNLVSSSTLTITAALASGGGTLAGNVTANAVNGAATFVGLAVSGIVGPRTLSFSSGGVTAVTSAPFTLAPGLATQLAIRTQPVAGTAYATFTTPAQVEIRDGAGNVVTSSTTGVTAAIASGGGTLGGTSTVAAVAGVATFASLTVNGAAGSRTLGFSAGNLTPVTSATFAVATAPPAVITFSPASVTMSVVQGANPPNATVNVVNGGVFPLTNLRVQGIAYNPLVPGGWISAQFTGGTSAPAVLTFIGATSTLPIGTYVATVQVAGDGATVTPVSLTVTLQVAAAIVITYGQATTKTNILNIGASVAPLVTITSGQGGAPTTDPTLSFASRAPSVATVDATGRVTGVAEGETWVAAITQRGTSDSVFVIVPRNVTNAILRTDLTQFAYRTGDTVTARIIVDTRGPALLGAITGTVSWTNDFFTGALTLASVSTATSTITPVFTVDAVIGVIRFSAASVAGVTGVIELATVKFVARAPGRTGWIYLSASEMIGADFSDLLAAATLTQYPVIVR